MKCVSSAMAGGVVLTVFLSATALAAEGDKPRAVTVEVAGVPSAVSHDVEAGNGTRAANHLLRTADSKRVPEKCGWETAPGKICSEHARRGSSHFGRPKLLTVATTTPAASTFRVPAGGVAAPAIGVASAADLLLDTDKADSAGVNRAVSVMDITQGTTASAHTVQAVENAVDHPAGAGTVTSEPPAYAVLLASLGIVAFIVTRRLN